MFLLRRQLRFVQKSQQSHKILRPAALPLPLLFFQLLLVSFPHNTIHFSFLTIVINIDKIFIAFGFIQNDFIPPCLSSFFLVCSQFIILCSPGACFSVLSCYLAFARLSRNSPSSNPSYLI